MPWYLHCRTTVILFMGWHSLSPSVIKRGTAVTLQHPKQTGWDNEPLSQGSAQGAGVGRGSGGVGWGEAVQGGAGAGGGWRVWHRWTGLRAVAGSPTPGCLSFLTGGRGASRDSGRVCVITFVQARRLLAEMGCGGRHFLLCIFCAI